MADTATANYNFTKPENTASNNTWGLKLNADLDQIDAALFAIDPIKAPAKATPILADRVGVMDSANSFAMRYSTLTDVAKTIIGYMTSNSLTGTFNFADGITVGVGKDVSWGTGNRDAIVFDDATNLFSFYADDVTSASVVKSGRLILDSTTTVTLSSTTHGFQVGPSTAVNLRLSPNRIDAVNNGVTTTLNINATGGPVVFGAGNVNLGGGVTTGSQIDISGEGEFGSLNVVTSGIIGNNLTVGGTLHGLGSINADSTITSGGSMGIGGNANVSGNINVAGNISQTGGATSLKDTYLDIGSGVGTKSSSYAFIVSADVSNVGVTSGLVRFNNLDPGTGSQNVLIISRDGSTTGSITHTGTSTTFNTSSDRRLKTNIVDLSSVADSGVYIDAIKPRHFLMRGEPIFGFIADEFQQIFPGSVSGTPNGMDADGNPEYQGMQAATSEVMAHLIDQVQSMRRRLAALEA